MAESNNLFNLITPFINQIQELEYVFDDLKLKRGIDTAEGAQLDGLGQILDEPRNGKDDASYVFSLKLKAALIVAAGTPESLISFVKDATQSDRVWYVESGTVGITIYVDGAGVLAISNTIVASLKKLLPAGVGINTFAYKPADKSNLGWADEDGHSTDGEGFLEKNYAETNGYEAGILTEQIV